VNRKLSYKKTKHAIQIGTDYTLCGDKIGKRMLLAPAVNELTCEHCQEVFMSTIDKQQVETPEGEAQE